jgi:replicative DNA helicase
MTGSTDNKSGNREQEISSISRSLKNVAKDLEVPVIALSQLSRAVETRGGNKKPQLSDLRESGAIEQDADLVVFLYRPEYYEILEDNEGQSLNGIAEVIVAKHRNGALVDIYLRFVSQYAKFLNLDEDGSQAFPAPSDQDLGEGSNVITRGSKINEMDDEDESKESADSFWNQKPDDNSNNDEQSKSDEEDEDVPF